MKSGHELQWNCILLMLCNGSKQCIIESRLGVFFRCGIQWFFTICINNRRVSTIIQKESDHVSLIILQSINIIISLTHKYKFCENEIKWFDHDIYVLIYRGLTMETHSSSV